jgi:type II secretory pathway pseudopilin PulG
MKLPNPSILRPAGRRSGFTMVEIAISLGVVAIALVAIMGVLPTGMRVQKDNREETVINQDGTYLIEALRSGSYHLDELTNHFEWIRISNSVSNVRYVAGPNPGDLNNGFKVLGLLGTPKFQLLQGRVVSNTITSRVRSICGGAAEKGKGSREFQFSYLLTSEVVPLSLYPSALTNFTESGLAAPEVFLRSNRWVQARNHESNFYELRLTFRWPLIEVGKDIEAGNNKKSFRAMVPGYLLATNQLYHFLQPNRFVQVQ